MHIVGIEQTDGDEPRVHTIDIWFSRRRQLWFVERLDSQGHQVGLAHFCADEQEAAACLAEWLRTHDETHLVAPQNATAAETRILAGHPQRRAA